MAKIFIVKPIGYGSGTLLGGTAVFSTDDHDNAETDSSADVASDLKSDTGTLASIGWSTDSISNSDWYDGSSYELFGIKVFKVSGFTDSAGNSTTTPSLTQINASEMISESWHSNHSNSQNGNEIDSGANNYTIDYSAFTITSNNGEVISFDNASTSYTASSSSNDALRSLDSTNNWYYNGILFGSQTGGSGQSEWWEIQQTADADEQSTKYDASNNDNLVDTEQFFPRTDITFVKKALTGAKSDDARDNALAYIIAHLETNGDKKRLPQRYRKIRTSLNISSIETLENDYRTHSA